MFRDVERNNWGILLSWCFALDSHERIAELIVLLLCLMMAQAIRGCHLKRCVLTSSVFACVYLFLNAYTGIRLPVLYLFLLSIDLGLLDEYLQQSGAGENHKDSALWLILTFCFYFTALFLPETMILDELRVRCFALITMIFLPLSFYYVFRAYLQELRRDMKKSTELRN